MKALSSPKASADTLELPIKMFATVKIATAIMYDSHCVGTLTASLSAYALILACMYSKSPLYGVPTRYHSCRSHENSMRV